MNNYVYIVASLPSISNDLKPSDRIDADGIIDEIRSLCSDRDCALIDTLMDGRKDENMTPEFYRRVTSESRSRFLRNYFTLDLNVRNCKARFLNKVFSRPESQDTIVLDEDGLEPFAHEAELMQILDRQDILEREKGMDELMWKCIDEATVFDYFDMDAILAFIAKLLIIDRWLKLDEQTGRTMFRQLVQEVRGSFEGVKFEG